MGSDAAPAGGARNPALGRPRDPIGRHYGRSARSSLDWDWHVASSQETRTRGQKSPRWSAERRAHLARCARTARCGSTMLRRSALRPPLFSRGKEGAPESGRGRRPTRGRLKNTGDESRRHSGARRRREPGIQKDPILYLDSGSGPADRPGMTVFGRGRDKNAVIRTFTAVCPLTEELTAFPRCIVA
jgi:hypothetical protein